MKIISGGQTGADQGGLIAAKALGLETGGVAPRGWLTESGPQQKVLQELFGLTECEQGGYPARTLANVAASDATIIFGDTSSPGGILTLKYCEQTKTPTLLVELKYSEEEAVTFVREFVNFLLPGTLNIAGNRESKCPGMQRAVAEILREALKHLSPASQPR